MKTLQKILAVIITLTVVFTLSASPVFADSSRLNLLCFGDSTASGFPLEGYNENGTYERLPGHQGHGGFHDLSYRSPSALLRDSYSDDDHFTNLCFEGQRLTDVRAFINRKYAAEIMKYELENNPNVTGYFTCRLNTSLDKQRYAVYKAFNEKYTKTRIKKSDQIYKRYNKDYPVMVQRYANISKCFTKSVKKADVIVLDGIMSNILIYSFNAAYTMITGNAEDVYNNSLLDLTDIPSDLKAKIKDLSRRLTDKLDEIDIPASKAKKLLNAFEFGYATACIDAGETVKDIHKINPDAEVIVMGPSNIIEDLCVNINNASINFGRIYGTVLDSASAYIRKNAQKGGYKFADFSSDSYETIFRELEDSETPEKLRSDDTYFSNLIIKTIRERIEDSKLTEDPGISPLYEALDPDTGNREIQNRLLQIAIDSSHFREGYGFSTMMSALQASDEKAFLSGLSGTVIEGGSAPDNIDALMFMHIFMNMGRAAGVHPSNQGCIDKYNAASRQIDSVKKNGETLSKSYLAKAKALYLTAKTVKTSKSVKLTASKIADLRNKLSRMRVYKKLSKVTEKKVCDTEKYLEKAEKCLKAKTK